MTLERLGGEAFPIILKELERLEAARRRSPAWSRKVCKASRRLHIRVWYAKPAPKIVVNIIKRLRKLRRAIEALGSSLPAGEAKRNVKMYGRNVGIREQSLLNYTNGKLPVLPPDAPEEERVMLKQVRLSQEIAAGRRHVDVAALLRKEGFPDADRWEGFTEQRYGIKATVKSLD